MICVPLVFFQVMKPMLERKRRARINRCLDELKEIMVTSLQAEGENVSKLEKADILELTVRHLHKLRRHQSLGLTPEAAYADRFKAGFTHCAAEVSQYLASSMQQHQQQASPAEPTIDPSSGVKLLQHLGSCIRRIETQSPITAEDFSSSNSLYSSPPCSPYDLKSTKLASCTDGSSSSMWRPWWLCLL